MSSPRQSMGLERFRDLAEAYGGDISRWPAGERDAAGAWLADHPREAVAVLDGARALDDLLGAWRTPEPAAKLRSQVLEPAPAIVRFARRRALVLTLGGGAGLAAACLAGILAAPFLLSTPASAVVPEPVAVVDARLAGATAATTPTDEVLSEVLAGWEAPVADAEADLGA